MLIGPGGAGKGTVAARLAARVERLWLSRSWTTRPRRAGEPGDAYVFTDRRSFMDRAGSGGFLEWAEFLGELYGTPLPAPPPGFDVLLEIDVQGARQVVEQCPDAVVVLLAPPSTHALVERMQARGDSAERARLRAEKGREEERAGRELAQQVVVNDDLDRAVEEVAYIVESTRAAAGGQGGRPGRAGKRHAHQDPPRGVAATRIPRGGSQQPGSPEGGRSNQE